MRHIRGVLHVLIDVDVRTVDKDDRLADEVSLELLRKALQRCAIDRLPITLQATKVTAFELREDRE